MKNKPAFPLLLIFAMLPLAAPNRSFAAPAYIQLVRPACPVRLGGVFTMGFQSSPFSKQGPISQNNLQWVATHCDVAAFPTTALTVNTFPHINRIYPAFTPLLYFYASCLYVKPHAGSVGGWDESMAKHVLRNAKQEEVPYPGKYGHWMDMGSRTWAQHWRKMAVIKMARYRAQGTVAAEMPVNNSFVKPMPKQYKTFNQRVSATEKWLEGAQSRGRFLLIPAALYFDHSAGHPTLPPPPGLEEASLQGLVWDDLLSLMDGAWMEGWVHRYWKMQPELPQQWEADLEAMDRYGLSGQVFIADAAYHNLSELEFDLASYLLVVHHQGRAVFQPMPLIDGRDDAGFSLDVMKQEVDKLPSYFNPPLGWPVQVRHMVPDGSGAVWTRRFQNGAVYVNSSLTRTITINLGSPMIRLNGKHVQKVVLPPQNGAVMLNLPNSD